MLYLWINQNCSEQIILKCVTAILTANNGNKVYFINFNLMTMKRMQATN